MTNTDKQEPLFKVFPCGANKIPLIKDWQKLATRDAGQIKKWMDDFGSRIISWGVPTGSTNDIIVLDVDVKKSNGFETLKGLKLPPTMSQRTPSGGAHYIYKYPNGGATYGNRVNFMPSLDCRGEGGYICWYGSDNTPINKCPEWLLGGVGKLVDLAHPPQPTYSLDPSIASGIVASSLDAIRFAPEGESNNILNIESFRLGQLVASKAITREHAEQVLFNAAKERGKPDYEAKRTIESGLNGGSSKPLISPFGPPNIMIDIPQPPQPERWTPNYFTIKDLTDMSKLRRPQLFKDWSTCDIQITTADGGTGKTTLKLYEAICLALGERFLGFQCINPGKTLFITGEDTAAKLGAMLGAIVKQMGLLEDKAKLDIILSSIIVKKDADLCIISKDKQGFLYPNQQAITKVLEAIKEFKPKMVVFDPISSFWGSEAALNDMAKAVSRFMLQLVDEGLCVEMINHMGKVSSANKDMTQFAGRGGTGLPSHSRVSRVLRAVDDIEYQELTNQTLPDNTTALMCNINKFSDGSPFYNKPFLIMRSGYIFSRTDLSPAKEREECERVGDLERVFKYIKEMRLANKYPTKRVIVGYFMTCVDKLSEGRTKRALDMLQFDGFHGEKVKLTQGPDATSDDKVFVVVDMDGREI